MRTILDMDLAYRAQRMDMYLIIHLGSFPEAV